MIDIPGVDRMDIAEARLLYDRVVKSPNATNTTAWRRFVGNEQGIGRLIGIAESLVELIDKENQKIQESQEKKS